MKNIARTFFTSATHSSMGHHLKSMNRQFQISVGLGRFASARRALLIALATSCASANVLSQKGPMQPTQFVVIHSPGPAWKPGVSAFEQDGLQLRVAHYAELLKAGKLLMGGPFLDGKSGGIMIARPGVSEEELHSFAAEAPAVKSGLLTFEIRPWLVGLHN